MGMKTRTKKEMQLLQKELNKVEHQENKMFYFRYEPTADAGISGKIRKKIPEKAMNALEIAFEKGFMFLFEKGDSIIEKTGSLEKAREQWQYYKESLDRMIIPQTLKAVSHSASGRVNMSKGVTTAEGSALGIFGIGLPDIPIFLAMLLKTTYEIAASYGIDYRNEEEKKYTLALLKVAFSGGSERLKHSAECDEIGKSIDDGEFVDTEITDEDITVVSQVLATDMLVAKFIQGITFVGVIGGPLNYRLVHKVSKIAKIKYKKRFLYRLSIEGQD